MYGREKLKTVYKTSCIADTEIYYDKDAADNVMDVMEAKIADLDDAFESCKANLESEKATNEELRERIKELEEVNKHLDDMVDAYQKSEALDIEKMDKKDARINELEEQCTRYQVELMNSDPALNPTEKVPLSHE